MARATEAMTASTATGPRSPGQALPLIGVLGGMGPAATADFYRKLVELTPAERDQDHLPLLIRAVPQIADRAASILAGGPSPEPQLVSGARWLQASGAALVVMPCNTAHLWHGPIQQALRVPMLHIVDAVLDEVRRRFAGRPVRLGLLATAATVRCGLYPKRAAQSPQAEGVGISWLAPDDEHQAAWVDAGIRAVKARDLVRARQLLGGAAKQLIGQGADALVLACTEVPLVLGPQPVPLLDSTHLLAEATVRWAGLDASAGACLTSGA
jgi:aspartate racemase